MALQLIKLPVQSTDDEQACYLQDHNGFTATAGGVPVLQHCVLVKPEHLKRWQASWHCAEILPATENSQRRYLWLDRDLKDSSQLAAGEAFVDVENFAGDYDPVYATTDGLKVDRVNFVPKKNEPKEVVIYVVGSDTLRTFVIQVSTRGFGMGDMGAARTDREAEIEYWWCGNPAFAYALGFDMSRGLNASPEYFVPVVKTETGTFHRCSDPGIAHAANTLTVYSTDPEVVIYKRFREEIEGLYAPDAGIGDSGTKRKKKNWPHRPDGVRLVRLLAARDGVPTSYKTQVSKKRKGRKFEKDGEGAVREGLEGEARGVVIGKSGVKRGAMPKKPNERAAELATRSGVPTYLASRGIRLDPGNELRTDQEWCHLLATSLKGSEEYYNFVLGSKHCNSEQLAIESALLFSLDAARRAGRQLKVKISAYLVPGTDYLLGEVIRYKVLMTREHGDDRLLLDHLIDAQSESLSYLEYRVLHETVRRVIAVELGEEHVTAYEDRLNGRIRERCRVEKSEALLSYTIEDDLTDELFVPDEDEDEDEIPDGGPMWTRGRGTPDPRQLPDDGGEDEDEAEDDEMGG